MALASCAGLDSGRPEIDSGASSPPPGPDGSVDAGSGLGVQDAGGSAPVDATTQAPPESEAQADGADGFGGDGACYDGLDNDGNGAADCEDASCVASAPSCCVGRVDVSCCRMDAQAVLDLATCTSTSVASCAGAGSAYQPFGSPAPTVDRFEGDAIDTLTPNGDTSDSGILFTDPLDPRAGQIEIAATIGMSSAETSEMALDALGLGFVDAGAGSDTLGRVAPTVGLLVSRSRRSVSLLIASEAVRAWEIGDEAFHRYALALSADGSVRLRIDGGVVADDGSLGPLSFDARVGASGSLRAVAYGRTSNLGADEVPTRLSSLEVTRTTCDMPAALARDREPILPAPGGDTSWTMGRPLGSPSVARWQDDAGTVRRQMVFSLGPDVLSATPGNEGFEVDRPEPALSAAGLPGSPEALSGPTLLLDPASSPPRKELWLTARTGDHGSVGRVLETGGRFEPSSWQVVLDPADHPEVSSFDGAAPFRLGSLVYAAVVERRMDGAQALALYEITLDGAAASRQATLHAPRGEDLFAFDRDEIAAPAVVSASGVHRLYYAGRRGTRWSVGLMVSDDGVRWRPPGAEPILQGSGSGFDALGVTDPAPVITDDGLALYYTGSDGVRTAIGVASGPVPPPRP